MRLDLESMGGSSESGEVAKRRVSRPVEVARAFLHGGPIPADPGVPPMTPVEYLQEEQQKAAQRHVDLCYRVRPYLAEGYTDVGHLAYLLEVPVGEVLEAAETLYPNWKPVWKRRTKREYAQLPRPKVRGSAARWVM